jgi:Ni2+-binding GTPase involved in maturation of urease and hydrogenase
MATARYLMIGGFLGAGKTTAILKLAEHLDARQRRVGLITNDQSVGLVDTAMLASHGFPVEEITGGCFCCRFNSLIDAADRLTESTKPEVFIAEPVGSCTDLRASVSYPLRQMYGESYSIAPLSVLVDPVRALRALGVEAGRSFTSKVLYVYRKQLEEAAIIVINKVDAVDPARIAALREAIAREFPRARVFEVSARTGQGLEAWFDAIVDAPLVADADLDIDYKIYGEGEALLGWLNATVRLAPEAEGPAFDGNAWLRDLASRIEAGLETQGIEIAHLKMTLSPGDEGSDLAVLNQVRNEQGAELSHELTDEVEAAELILNLRAEGDPALLQQTAMRAIEEAAAAKGLTFRIVHEEHFRPGQPNPTWRLATA